VSRTGAHVGSVPVGELACGGARAAGRAQPGPFVAAKILRAWPGLPRARIRVVVARHARRGVATGWRVRKPGPEVDATLAQCHRRGAPHQSVCAEGVAFRRSGHASYRRFPLKAYPKRDARWHVSAAQLASLRARAAGSLDGPAEVGLRVARTFLATFGLLDLVWTTTRGRHRNQLSPAGRTRRARGEPGGGAPNQAPARRRRRSTRSKVQRAEGHSLLSPQILDRGAGQDSAATTPQLA
jgi:hypothetical protein